MKLTHEQALHGANVFSDYFDKFGRIDEYMREQKLASMAERSPVLFGMGPEEDLFSDFTISPADMEFELIELPQDRWDTYLNMISSHSNMTSIPGRCLRLAVLEKKTQKWVGFIRLGSPVINCKPRNEMLGRVFTQHEGGAQRFNQCAAMGFVIVPAQPFGFNYLGGKLLAAICTTHEVRKMLDEKYKMTTCLFETTSLYGSSKAVSQYDGMKPLIRFKGLTDSDFLPMLHGKTYTDLKDYIEGIIGEDLAPQDASSRKLKISNSMVNLIKVALKGTPEGAKFTATIENAKNLNEQKRYFISDYGFKNMIEFVNGDTEKLIPGENYEKHHLANIIEWWRKKAINRFDTLTTENRIRTEQEVWTSGKVLDIIR
jgi:Domain of unknown function (DUF4338)